MGWENQSKLPALRSCMECDASWVNCVGSAKLIKLPIEAWVLSSTSGSSSTKCAPVSCRASASCVSGVSSWVYWSLSTPERKKIGTYRKKYQKVQKNLC